MQRILMVDDDPTVVDVVSRYLKRDGYATRTAVDGETGLELFRAHGADLVILDLMMPKLDGLEVCKEIRATSQTPIIILTALGEEADRILGLEIGADDYLTKPFSPRELVLRVASILRRTVGPSLAEAVELFDGGLALDRAARTVRLNGNSIDLSAREFDLLAHLMTRPGIVFSREALMEQVWGWTFGDHTTVTVHVRRLREKIESEPAAPSRIKTVWGVGYRYDRVTDPEVS